jgi:hypothetical protein
MDTQESLALSVCPLCDNHCPLSEPSCPKGEAYARSMQAGKEGE